MPSIGDSLLLKRGDLLTFPKDTVDLILEMQKEGWRGHKDSKGHVKMLAPDGETHVMATSNRNSPTYLRQGYTQYNKRGGVKKEEKVAVKVSQKWPCARPLCPKVYATEQQLSDHIMVDHEKLLLCPELDCHETFKRPAGLGLHRANKHGYISPTKAKRAAQKAEKQKSLKETVAEVVKEALPDIPVYTDVPDGTKFDTELLENHILRAQGEQPIMDTMVVEPITEHQKSLKEMGAKFINDGVVVVPDDWTPEFTTPVEGPIFVGTMAEQVKVRDFPTRNVEDHGHLEEWDSQETFDRMQSYQDALESGAVAGGGAGVDRTVTLNLDEILDLDIRTVARVLHAAGLTLEIRGV